MKLNDTGENRTSFQMALAIVGVGAAVLIILLIVIIPNVLDREKAKSPSGQSLEEQNNTDGGNSPVVNENISSKPGAISPSDLDFWELYPKEDTDIVETVPGGSSEQQSEVAEEENDPSKDGKHTEVTLRDGSTEWVVISQYLPKHDYDYTNLVCKNDEMQYFIDGERVSYFGIDISKYQDYIDFNKVKRSGIDFVMIRVGSRGYGTGQISIDDYYYDNIKRASDAGLMVGLYFTSQAISKDEAIEEANTVLDAIGEYRIDYPIAFDMEFVKNDTARIEALTKDQKTEIAKAFLDTIGSAGYTGMIYGDKEWLIKEIDMSKLSAYDVWLSQSKDLPDYPYRFSMWQYKTNGNVNGVAGYVTLNISFVDYSEK